MALENAIEPLTFAMTQNTWVKALEPAPHRDSIRLENEDTTNSARYQFPIGNNPFAYDFVTNTDIDISAILTAPNTWASATRGSIIVRFKADAHAGLRYLVSFGDTDGTEHLSLWIDDDEKIAATAVKGAAIQWEFKTDQAISTGVWYTVKLRMKDTRGVPTLEPLLFLNGGTANITFSTSTDKTAWMDVLTVTDNAFIGSLNIGSTTADYFEGEIDSVKIIEHESPTAEGGGNNLQIAQYRLDEGTGTTAGDSLTHGDDGTITAGGGAWIARSDGTLVSTETVHTLSLSENDTHINRALWLFTAAATHDMEILETQKSKIKV